MLSNCILWAYWMRRKRGSGYVYWRKSVWGFFPHCLYGDYFDGHFYLMSYRPIDPRKRLIPPPLFRGKVMING